MSVDRVPLEQCCVYRLGVQYEGRGLQMKTMGHWKIHGLSVQGFRVFMCVAIRVLGDT